MRNRLTHTLEVVQISKKISRNLELNMDLTEAIAFGHDIGHTPFGHAGERVLNKVMNGCYKFNGTSINPINDNFGFKHNWQSIRVLRDLNIRYDGDKGFDISKFTEWGILRHTNTNYKKCDRIIDGGICGNYYSHDEKCNCSDGFKMDFYTNIYPDIDTINNLSLEGIVVKRSDDIAQRHHDIEDGLFSELVDIDELIKYFPQNNDIFDGAEKSLLETLVQNNIGKSKKIKMLSHIMHGVYTRDLILNSGKNLSDFKEQNAINDTNDFQTHKSKKKQKESIYWDLINFSDGLIEFDKELKKFLKNAILHSMMAQGMDSKAEYIITELISAYLKFPQYLPKKTLEDILIRINAHHYQILSQGEFKNNVRKYIAHKHFTKLKNNKYLNFFLRGICDFIAGMTDDFAYKQFNLIYGTQKITTY